VNACHPNTALRPAGAELAGNRTATILNGNSVGLLVEVRAAFPGTITANDRIEDALTPSSIIPKVFGDPYLYQFEFQMGTENCTERCFVQVVKETFPLHPLRVSVFEGQVGDAIWLERP
jgi:hypothetical protein